LLPPAAAAAADDDDDDDNDVVVLLLFVAWYLYCSRKGKKDQRFINVQPLCVCNMFVTCVPVNIGLLSPCPRGKHSSDKSRVYPGKGGTERTIQPICTNPNPVPSNPLTAVFLFGFCFTPTDTEA
jgi:hypothetical protein